MNYEVEINKLNDRLNSLQDAFIQAQRNQVPFINKVDDTSYQVSEIAPYKESKTAYIDDTQVVFDNAKDGDISVFMVDGDGNNVPHTFERINGQIVVSFEKRNSLATVTISIQ